MLVQLKRFDPAGIPDNATCLFVGKRGTGKTTCVKDILYHHRHIDSGVCMSGTEECNEFWGTCIPDSFIFPDYEPTITHKLIRRQRRARQRGNMRNVFFIAEDVLYDKRLSKDKNVRGIFMNGRHWGILFLVTMQYVMDIPPGMRSNIDYIFAFREHVLANREKLWRSYFGLFPSFEVFDQVFLACTEGFDCLVLDNTKRSNKVEDCVYWFQANPKRKFKCGSKQYWGFHVVNYAPPAAGDGSDDEFSDDEEAAGGKARRPKHTVQKLQ